MHTPPATLAILSDIHYAGPAEQARGDHYEHADIKNPFIRFAAESYRDHVWLRYPLRQNGLLDRFCAEVGAVDLVIANGDYSCSTGFVGLAHDAAFESARLCVGKLREQFGPRLTLLCGDHELGKLSMVGGRGGMRLAAWRRAVHSLGVAPFWQLDLGRYALLGVTSSLIALPLLTSELLPEERAEWERLREEHLALIRAAFDRLGSDRRILLFCHDPTALPWLSREAAVRQRLPQIEQTVIGHLHSQPFLWQSRLLAGMPVIKFLGSTPKKLSSALNQARLWRPFRVRLCPSLAGTQLFGGGGYYTARLDPAARTPVQFHFHPLRRLA